MQIIHVTKIILLGICFLLLSCSRYPRDVENALQQSGENRDNLIAVLEHFRNNENQLKYKAACFLIANMPYHKSLMKIDVAPEYEIYFNSIDSILRQFPEAIHDNNLKQELAARYDNLPNITVSNGNHDIKTVTSTYLVDCIEEAFNRWETSPLLQKMEFDEFKEYILPYRVVNEPLPPMKQKLYDLTNDCILSRGLIDIHMPIEQYKQHALAQKSMNRFIKTDTHTGIYDIYLPVFAADCGNLAATTCNIFRACGIPVVYEFTPQWTDRSNRHYWCASPDGSGKFKPYTPPYNNLMEDWELSIKHAGKIYRATYEANKNTPYFLKSDNETIPEIFDNPCIADVTDNYHQCYDIELPVPDEVGKNKLAYLAFFNIYGLNPVAWGKISGQSAKFEKVPLNMVFFPVYISSNDGKPVQFNKPFVIKKTSSDETAIDFITCNFDSLISMHLLRKFPHKPHLVKYRENLNGALILASNHEKGRYDTLYHIPATPKPYWQRYTFANNNKYRYYKIATADGSPVEIAEYEWLCDRKTINGEAPNPLPILKHPEEIHIEKFVKISGQPMRSGPLRMNATDEDLNTYAESPWVGTCFNQPVCITGLQLYPRNARNGIEHGNEYALMYFHDGKWVEHCRIKATYEFLDIDNVPGSTIYLLRNLTSGKEELPFFYHEGKQIFISELQKSADVP